MATTYTPIATTTLGAATASVTFSSIPATYTDLVFVMNASAVSVGDAKITLNGNTSSTMSSTRLAGNGTSASSARTTGGVGPFYITYNGSIPGTPQRNITVINFMNYSNTTTYKTLLIRGNATDGSIKAEAILFQNTGAISSFTLDAIGQNFDTGSTFSLYGIKAA